MTKSVSLSKRTAAQLSLLATTPSCSQLLVQQAWVQQVLAEKQVLVDRQGVQPVLKGLVELLVRQAQQVEWATQARRALRELRAHKGRLDWVEELAQSDRWEVPGQRGHPALRVIMVRRALLELQVQREQRVLREQVDRLVQRVQLEVQVAKEVGAPPEELARLEQRAYRGAVERWVAQAPRAQLELPVLREVKARLAQ